MKCDGKPSGYAAQRNLRLSFLDSHFLEVHELRLLNVQRESSSILTLWISTYSRLGVAELLSDIWDETVAITAFECA